MSFGGGTNSDGAVFEIPKTSDGYASTPTLLASFNGADGKIPQGGLVVDGAGNLIGTAAIGGTHNYGTVFEIAKTSDGYVSTPILLASFNIPDGIIPNGGLVADAAGNLFGTTQEGGKSNLGTVFEIKRTESGYASTPTVLANFNSTTGGMPQGGLTADAAGNLFGTAQNGGSHGFGSVFEISNAGFQVTLPASPGGIDLSSLNYISSYEVVWSSAANLLQIIDTADANAVVATLSIAGTLTGGLVTLSPDSATGTEVSLTPNSLVSVAPGDTVFSNIPSHSYSAYEIASAGTSYFSTGITGAPYTSKAVQHDAKGKPKSASFSNGMTETWTYNPDGSYQTAFVGVTGAPYTSEIVQYGADGRPESASFSNGMTETWTCNPDGSSQADYAGVTGAPYTSKTVQFGTDGKPESASFSNGMTEIWTYNPDGTYQEGYLGVTGAPYTSKTVQYGADRRPQSASFSNGMTQTWTYNPDGSYQATYADVTGKPYTSETVQYAANARPESASFSDGMTEIWTYESDGSYEAAFADVTGGSYTALKNAYNASGELETSLTTNQGRDLLPQGPSGRPHARGERTQRNADRRRRRRDLLLHHALRARHARRFRLPPDRTERRHPFAAGRGVQRQFCSAPAGDDFQQFGSHHHGRSRRHHLHPRIDGNRNGGELGRFHLPRVTTAAAYQHRDC